MSYNYLFKEAAYLLVTVFCVNLISSVSSAPSDGIKYSGTLLRSEEPIPRGCLYHDYRYDHGELVRTEQPCLNCTCARGVLQCFLRVCPLLSMPPQGCFTARKDGECCPSFICSSDAPSGVSEVSVPITLSEFDENETLPPDDYLQLAGEAQKEHSVTLSYYSSGINIPDFPEDESNFNESAKKAVNDSEPVMATTVSPIIAQFNNHGSNDSFVIITSTPTPSFLYLEDDFDFNSHNVISGGCFINGSLYAEGSAMISGSFCEYCYCIRAKTMCVKPKCNLSIDNCKPKYSSEYSCCPTSYNCKKNQITTTTTTISSTLIGQKSNLTKACEFEGRIYYTGDPVISRTNCQNCFCTDNGVKCQDVDCSPVVEGCLPIIPEGHCCPVEFVCNNTKEGLVSIPKNNDSESNFDLDDVSSTIHNVSLKTNISNITSLVNDSSIYNNLTLSFDNVNESYKTTQPSINNTLNESESSTTDLITEVENEFGITPILVTNNDTNPIIISSEGDTKFNGISSYIHEQTSFNETNKENETNIPTNTDSELPNINSSDLSEKPKLKVETEEFVELSNVTRQILTNSTTQSTQSTILEPELTTISSSHSETEASRTQDYTTELSSLLTDSGLKNDISTALSLGQVTSTPLYQGTEPNLVSNDSNSAKEESTKVQDEPNHHIIELTTPFKDSNENNLSEIVNRNENVKLTEVVTNIESQQETNNPTEVSVISTTRGVEETTQISTANQQPIEAKTNLNPETKKVDPDMNQQISRVNESASIRENDRLTYFPKIMDALKGLVNFSRRVTESENSPSSAQPIYINTPQRWSTVPTKIISKFQIPNNGWKPIVNEPPTKQNSEGVNIPENGNMEMPPKTQFHPLNDHHSHSFLYYARPPALNKKPDEVLTYTDSDHRLHGTISTGLHSSSIPYFSKSPINTNPVPTRSAIPEEEYDDKSPFGFERRSGQLFDTGNQFVLGSSNTKVDIVKPPMPLKENVEIITAPSVFDPNSDIDFGRHHLYNHEMKQSRSDSETRVVSLKQVLKVSPEAAGRPGSVFNVMLNGDDGEAYFRAPQDSISKKVDTESDIIYTGPEDLAPSYDHDPVEIRKADPPVKKITLIPKEPKPFRVIPFLAEDAVGQKRNETGSIFVGLYPTPKSTPTGTEKMVPIKEGKCVSNTRVYDNGEIMAKEDPCELCRCFYGRELCQKQVCPEPPSDDCFSEKLNGYCCPRFTCGTRENPQSSLPISHSVSKVPEPQKVEVSTPLSTTAEVHQTVSDVYDEIYSGIIGAIQHKHNQNVPISIIPNASENLENQTFYEPETILTTLKPISSTKPPITLSTLKLIKLKPISTQSPTITTPITINIKSNPANYQDSTTVNPISRPPVPTRTSLNTSRPNITKIKIMKPLRKPILSTTSQPSDEALEPASSTTTIQPTTVTKKTVESDNAVWGKLKVSGCNIFGKFYNLNDFVKDLSGPCNTCICSSHGVECTPQC